MISNAIDLNAIIGVKITDVEVVSVNHSLRILFENNVLFEAAGSWRIRSGKKVILGSGDIDFFADATAEMILDSDKKLIKKVDNLIGKTIVDCKIVDDDIYLSFSDGKYLDIFWNCGEKWHPPVVKIS